jgi:hypothetical protein
MLTSLAQALKIDVLELFSIESIKRTAKKNIKDAILADIDQILTLRLIEEK